VERPGNTVKSSGREAHLGRLSQPPSSETLGVVTVMFDSKRRPASTQAVSRKVEGIEPRNQGKQLGSGLRFCDSRKMTSRTFTNTTVASDRESDPNRALTGNMHEVAQPDEASTNEPKLLISPHRGLGFGRLEKSSYQLPLVLIVINTQTTRLRLIESPKLEVIYLKDGLVCQRIQILFQQS
jgi:hypothetical protein